jgi:CRISPR-associated protein Csb2
LVAAAAARSRGNPLDAPIRAALEWLEQQPAPIVLAPRGQTAEGYRTSVPHNEMDIVARAWSRGNYSNSGDANPATHKTMKLVKRTYLLDGDTIHYLWALPQPLTEELQARVALLSDLARSVVALGWGIDMAVGHCAILSPGQLDHLSGERWHPAESDTADGLRVPTPGQLTNLTYRHQHFLDRPRPLRHPCRTVAYRRSFDPATRPCVTFALLDPNRDVMRPFDPDRHAITVAHLTRHAVKRAAHYRWPSDQIARIVMGHGERPGDQHDPVEAPRLAFLPLPTFEFRPGKPWVASSIRRVMLTVIGKDQPDQEENLKPWIDWAQTAMPGRELTQHDSAVALLSSPQRDRIVLRYLNRADTWATVTPVILPGYDDPRHYRRRLEQGVNSAEQRELLDRINARIDGLLRKAIMQAGFSPELAQSAELDWRSSGFFSGVDLASRYTVPDYLKRFPRVHVRITWRDPAGHRLRVPGPICLGGGRFFGLGLFATLDHDA